MADPQDARQTPKDNREVPDLDPSGPTSRATDRPKGAPEPADGPPADHDARASAPVSTDTPVITDHGVVPDTTANPAAARK
ncbi:hypothetical protein [Alienimonas californiensis]|uniref:Uncharacterized protein n=1 Tax=Alienimonas californiensis TaxID=2527989 RepID=A0A517PCN5_9PLAN|nr:hypothetical protein [Alienimonas californiensis]QDT17144.1 hypothetical protein CA12_32560 [Alienimonas californiensis]